MIIQICVGSSCHLKGSEKIVSLLQDAVTKRHLEDEITLAGNFCIGQCNRDGVTLQVDDEVYTGVTAESFSTFFQEHILSKIDCRE